MTRMHRFTFTPTPFIGRSQEMNEISALLDEPGCRLLTLVGPGGIGKTRLALEVASRKSASSAPSSAASSAPSSAASSAPGSAASFPDGLFFVPLASLNRADDMLTAIAEATPFQFSQDA